MIDLNKARAARREVKGTGPTVKFGRRTYQLPAELPFEVVERMSDVSAAQTAAEAEDGPEDPLALPRAFGELFRALLGSDYGSFMEERPSIEDLGELMSQLLPEYGLTSGESEASAKS